LVICLSHLGYSYKESKVSDLIVAQEVEGIDLIIGAHTHNFLQKPTLMNKEKGQATLVNQVGYAGINLGRIDFIVSDRKVSSTKRLIEVK
jgi:5'-nucleotidase